MSKREGSELGSTTDSKKKRTDMAVIMATLPSTPDEYPNSDHFNTPAVKVIVGASPNRRTFHVHKGLACFYSGYFQSALQGAVKHEIEKTCLTLADQDPKIFAMAHSFMCTRFFSEDRDDSTLSFSDLYNLWIMGDTLQMPLLQNAAVDAIMEKFLDIGELDISLLPRIYKRTVPESPLRRLLIDIAGKVWGPAATNKEREKYWCTEAHFDLTRVLWTVGPKRLTKAEVCQWDMCEYHVHGEDEFCEV